MTLLPWELGWWNYTFVEDLHTRSLSPSSSCPEINELWRMHSANRWQALLTTPQQDSETMRDIIEAVVCLHDIMWMRYLALQNAGPRLNIKTIFPGMGIPILVRHLYIETPRRSWSRWCSAQHNSRRLEIKHVWHQRSLFGPNQSTHCCYFSDSTSEQDAMSSRCFSSMSCVHTRQHCLMLNQLCCRSIKQHYPTPSNIFQWVHWLMSSHYMPLMVASLVPRLLHKRKEPHGRAYATNMWRMSKFITVNLSLYLMAIRIAQPPSMPYEQGVSPAVKSISSKPCHFIWKRKNSRAFKQTNALSLCCLNSWKNVNARWCMLNEMLIYWLCKVQLPVQKLVNNQFSLGWHRPGRFVVLSFKIISWKTHSEPTMEGIPQRLSIPGYCNRAKRIGPRSGWTYLICPCTARVWYYI